MRIRRIHIAKWRNFEDVSLELDDDAALVCIVGANGTGKSHLLELIAACTHRLGLSQGVDIPRGDPFADPHEFAIQFYVAPLVSEATDAVARATPEYGLWDRTLTIQSQRNLDGGVPPNTTITAGGVSTSQQSSDLALSVTDSLRQSKSVHFLSLDADRAYPKKSLNVNEVVQAYDTDWTGVEYTRGRSFRATTTLYDEWIKYFLAKENQLGTRLIEDMRRAGREGTPPPEFEDHFAEYAAALQRVLPQLVFTGVDPKGRTLLFDTTGSKKLTFNQLSGGERELAFLVGQIDRFGLRNGIFLLDEPELHLNSDLVRAWITYLTGTIATGQIWLATHSLEAVEAAGQHATFVIERNEATRSVGAIVRLDSRPILAALSRAVGTPAFSISQLAFVCIEGDEGIGEREAFHRLAGQPPAVRFIECGSCNEVVRRVATLKTMANETDAGIRIGGIIDRDFRSTADARRLASELGIAVLPVHELENFFLHPPTVDRLLVQNGLSNLDALNLIRDAADARAGGWIFQYAMASRHGSSLPSMPAMAKERAKAMSWNAWDTDSAGTVEAIVSVVGFSGAHLGKFSQLLEIAQRAYGSQRESENLWRDCEGKQVLNDICRRIGFANAPTMMQATFALWEREIELLPEELNEVRNYIGAL